MLKHPKEPVREKQLWEMLPAQPLLPQAYRQNRLPVKVETLALAQPEGQHYYVRLMRLYENARGNNALRPASAGQLSRCFQAERFVSEMQSCHVSQFKSKTYVKPTYISMGEHDARFRVFAHVFLLPLMFARAEFCSLYHYSL